MRLTSNADGSPSDHDRAITVLRRAIELGVNHVDTASYYFSATRSAHELINTCGEQGVAFVPFFAIAGAGCEAGASGADDDEILAIAGEHGATAAQIRLAWTLHRGPHVLAIPGTGNPDHVVANVAAGAIRLSADDLARLESLHRGHE